MNHVLVAIDFGTAFSGYAFCFVRDPGNIHVMRRWEGGDPGINNQKTPSCLLLDPNGSFHSFGYAARDYFHDLESQEAKKWMYFDKFKMTLYNNLVSGLQKIPIPLANFLKIESDLKYVDFLPY